MKVYVITISMKTHCIKWNYILLKVPWHQNNVPYKWLEAWPLYLSFLKESRGAMALIIWRMLLLNVLSGLSTANSIQTCSAKWTIEEATSTSCLEVQKTDSSVQCFAACLSNSVHFYSFSRSRETRSCYCCQNPPSNVANAVPDQGLVSYKTCTYFS